MLIDDTYLAVIERFVSEPARASDEQVERTIVGLQDVVVAELIAEQCGLDQPIADTLAARTCSPEPVAAEYLAKPLRVSTTHEMFRPLNCCCVALTAG